MTTPHTVYMSKKFRKLLAGLATELLKFMNFMPYENTRTVNSKDVTQVVLSVQNCPINKMGVTQVSHDIQGRY